MMLFSPHNVLRDPPFSQLDLVSCRNLMIYLNRDAQERALNTFHFALRPDGILVLGSSEAAESLQQFTPLDIKNRIFERRIAPTGLTTDTLVTASRWLPSRAPFPIAQSERPSIGSFGELHHRAVMAQGLRTNVALHLPEEQPEIDLTLAEFSARPALPPNA